MTGKPMPDRIARALTWAVIVAGSGALWALIISAAWRLL